MPNFTRNHGFSLVELSVVMVIVGFIAASALSVAITSDYPTKREETETKMLRIEEALAGYVATNHRLPCPASGTVAITDDNFGLEGTQTADDNCPNKDFVDATTFIVGGVVPVTTLQLPDDFMFDGWGHRIDYIVDSHFTNNDTTNAAGCLGVAGNVCFRDTVAGSLTVNDESGTARTTEAIYVLLSHGENGHGAFPKPGSATSARINGFQSGNPYRNATASVDEYTNAKVDSSGATVTPYDGVFVMRDYLRVDDGSASDGTSTTRVYFDDQVRYKTKSQLVKAAGATIYDSICKTALAIVNTPGSNDCTGATDSTQCETFATSINSNCLQ